MSVRIEINCASNLIDEQTEICVTGLVANEYYQIQAESIDDLGRIWRSSATFQSDHQGRIDLSKMKPVAGTYDIVDGCGLFWSMEIKGHTLKGHFIRYLAKQVKKFYLYPAFAKWDCKPHVVFFFVYKDGRLLVKKKWQMVFQASDVRKISLYDPFVGKYFVSEGKSHLPAVIVLGGSGGGFAWSEQVTAVLASHGFAAMAVAYFDYRGRWGLPKGLANIPLELFEKVVQWLLAREEVDQRSIHMVGISKGGELALLLASHFPQYFDKVVAYVPSSYVFQGIQMGEKEKTSSWSYQGKPLACVPYPEAYQSNWNMDKSALREIHHRAMQNKEALKQARIPIERMKCDLLLISGDSDALWPSSEMCEEIVDSLKKCQYPYTVRHLRYREAGHGFFVPNLPPMLIGPKNRAKPIAMAERDAWRQMLDFLQGKTPSSASDVR